MIAQQVAGELTVDMDGRRARYECLRPGCPQRREGPVHATDRDPGGGRLGTDGLRVWIDGIKTAHLAQHHHGSTP